MIRYRSTWHKLLGAVVTRDCIKVLRVAVLVTATLYRYPPGPGLPSVGSSVQAHGPGNNSKQCWVIRYK